MCALVQCRSYVPCCSPAACGPVPVCAEFPLHKGLAAVVPCFKRELFKLTTYRKVKAQTIEYVDKEIEEVVVVEEPDGAKPKPKAKGKGAQEEEPETKIVKRIVQEAVVKWKDVELEPVFDFDDCTAIIDYVSETIFQHSALYTHVYRKAQAVNHTKKRLFVNDCFPPQVASWAVLWCLRTGGSGAHVARTQQMTRALLFAPTRLRRPPPSRHPPAVPVLPTSVPCAFPTFVL